MWVVLTDREDRSVSMARLDPHADEVSPRIPLEGAPARHNFDEVAVGMGSVWALALEGLDHPGDVIRIDPETNRVAARVRADALNMAAGPDGLWITGCVDCDEHRTRSSPRRSTSAPNEPHGPRLAMEQVALVRCSWARDRCGSAGTAATGTPSPSGSSPGPMRSSSSSGLGTSSIRGWRSNASNVWRASASRPAASLPTSRVVACTAGTSPTSGPREDELHRVCPRLRQRTRAKAMTRALILEVLRRLAPHSTLRRLTDIECGRRESNPHGLSATST